MREIENIFGSARAFNRWYAEISGNQQAKSGWQKIVDYIFEIIDDIKRALKLAKLSKADRAEAIAQLERIKELYTNAYKAAENTVAERRQEQAKQNSDTNSANALENKTNKEYNGNINHSLKKATDEGYSTEGTKWAVANGLLTKNEQAKFWEDIANLSKLDFYIPKSKNGQYIIDVGQKLVFTNGDFKATTISGIIEFNDGYEENINEYKEWIIDEERDTAQHRESLQIIEIVQGEGYVSEHIPSDYRTDARENGRRKGTDSTETNRRSQKDVSRNFSLKETAPTFYSHMGKTIDGIKQDKIGANSVVSYLKGRGVKDEEIKWSGIETFLEGKKSVTKAELQEFVAGSMLQVEEYTTDNTAVEVISEDGDNYIVRDKNTGEVLEEWEYSDDVEDGLEGYRNKNGEIALSVDEIEEKAMQDYFSTRWQDYKLNGGTNYREVVFKMPNSTYSNPAMRTHWGADAEGVLAHARIQDFDVDGGKMLFIEEIQSDWHNLGNRNGYRERGQKTEREIRLADDKAYDDFVNNHVARIISDRMREAGYENAPTIFANLWDGNLSSTYAFLESIGVSLTNDEKGYIEEEVYKSQERHRELKNAAPDNAAPDAPFRNNYHEYVLKSLIRTAAEKDYDSIGWTTAEIQSKRWSDSYAEGYRIEYDQDIPKFLNKYGKKWGAKVGQSYVNPVEGNEDYIAQSQADIEDYRRQIEEIGEDASENEYVTFLTEGIVDLKKGIEKLKGTKVWSMPITDSMKESVLYEGQPMYSLKDSDYLKAVESEQYGVMWTLDKGVLNNNEVSAFYEKISETKSSKYPNYHEAFDGQFIYEISNKLIYTDGDYDYPHISKVITINTNNNYWLEYGMGCFYEGEQYGYETDTIIETVEAVLGEGAVETATYSSYETDKRSRKSRDERTDSPETNRRSQKDVNYSLKNWHTDLSKNDLIELMNEIKYDIRNSKNAITDEANWLFTDIGGKDVFAIYSTDDYKDPTLLYESKGKKANLERDILMDLLEVIENGESINGQSSFASRIPEGDWVQKINSSQDNLQHVGRGSNNRNAGVLQRQPRRDGSRAFRNVIENLFEVSDGVHGRGRGVRDGVNYSLKGGLSGTEIRNAITKKKLDKYVDKGIITTEKYNELVKTYGAIPEGEKPYRAVQVPQRTDEDKKVSQTVRTILEAKATPDEALPTIEKMVEDGVFSYDTYTDEQAINDADSYIKKYGWDESLDDWFKDVEKGVVSKQHTAMGWALYNNAANIAATTTSETERTSAVKTSLKILDAMVRVQIFQKY